jgi:DNA recombination protein RmuC
MQLFYIVALALLALLAGLLAARLHRQTRQAVTTAEEAGDHARQAETDISTLRMAKFEIERRLAVEEQKAARIPELETALTAAAGRIDQSRLAKVAAESEMAVAREATIRLEAALAEAKEREATADRTRSELRAQIDILKDQIGQMEHSSAGKAEMVAQHEQVTDELRQRLGAVESARNESAARLDSAVQARTGLEANLAIATAQVQDKSQRVEALEEELRQARSEIAARLDSAAQAKLDLETNLARTATQAEEKSQRVAALEDELRQARAESAARLDSAAQANTDLEANLARGAAQVEEKSRRVVALEEELRLVRSQSEAAHGQTSDQRARLAALEEALDQERKHGAEKLALLAGAREQMTEEFRLLAEDVIRRHSETVNQQNKAQIEVVLTPLRERLAEFQQGLLSAHDESARERLALANQIRQLSDNSAQMSAETQQLASLLKGKAHGLGAWGEVLLSSILERSGLREGEDYVLRESYSPAGGQRLRPDVVINLPGDQRVIIDSKVPLTAFEAYVNAENDAESALQLSNHVAALAGHIKALVDRGPPPAAESKLDYTVMFVPVEGALAAALREDPNLTGLAVENHIALATPATLMMALRSIANVWQAERRNRRAESIADRAGKLYDSFAAYLGDMEVLGDHLVRARHAYEEALGKLSSGRDNLIGQVEELKEMGAKATKPLPRISAGERKFEGSEAPGPEPANEDTNSGA